MYPFSRASIGPFTLHTSDPAVGDTHRKRFGPGVTPTNQATLNLYVAGRFEIEIPALQYRREMLAGECSLDIELPAFPSDLCIERCLEEGSRRICIAPTVATTRWSRHLIDLAAGSASVAPADHLLVVLVGTIEVDGEAVAAGEARMLAQGQVLRSAAPSRAALMVAHSSV